MTRTLLFLFCAVLLCAGCETDEPDDQPQGSGLGDVFVRVISGGQAVAGAAVRTDPASVEMVTDELGTVLLEAVPEGNYRIFADLAPIGRGVSPAMVVEDELLEVTVVLQSGFYISPTLTLRTSTGSSQFDITETVTLVGMVADDGELADFVIDFTSDLDGDIGQVAAAPDGSFELILNSLSEGQHSITATTIDADEIETSRSISVLIVRQPDAVILDSLLVTGGSLQLFWQPTTNENFSHYEIYRSSDGPDGFFSFRTSIDDVDQAMYTDENISIGVTYYYRVRLVLNNGASVDSELISGLYQPSPVNIDSVSIIDGGLTIFWEPSDNANFSRYTIRRSTSGEDGFFQQVASIDDVTTRSYVDQNVELGTTYHYKIILRLLSGGEIDGEAFRARYQLEGIDLMTGIVRMKADDERPYIYALDRANNNMLFINTSTETVEKTIFVGSSPTDLTISFDNTTAYIANYGSSQIAVVDLNTQEKTGDISVDTDVGTWDGNPYRLTMLSNNRIAFTSEDQWNSIKVINAGNGVNLFTAGSIYQPGLITNSTGTLLFATESGSSGSQAIRYTVQDNGLLETSASFSSSNGNRDACITRDNNFLFYNGSKLLVNNMSTELGSINDEILACTDSGDVVVGERNIWDGETFAIISNLQFEPDLAVIPAGSRTAYLYSDATSQLIVVELPE